MLLYTGTVWHPVAVCAVSCALGIAFWITRKYAGKYGVKKSRLLYLVSLLFSIFAVLDQRIVHTGQFDATIDQAYLMPGGKAEIGVAILLSVFVFQAARSIFVLLSFLLSKMQDGSKGIKKALMQLISRKMYLKARGDSMRLFYAQIRSSKPSMT